jgi:hypothetical protein
MTTLAEATRPSSAPSRWTHEKVKQRLFEAFSVERRLPGQGLRRVASAWPATPLLEFADVAGNMDALRKQQWENWARAKGAWPHEISMMEEAMNWLRWLQGDELVYLQAWAFAVAYRRKQSVEIRKRGIAKTTFYRTVDRAAKRIADRLNDQGVQVRCGRL